ncbi:prepilin-type N-terminal cleavage/methylation domain-containing protein [Vibrio hippocampi]|uniref:MSHA biogenesis protein MshD n=1 Tax=Vibrio hippocampi TaxID=654686 RepID=A0ABN8DGY7_9VIBR|nr:prepilin-type N-terminal cleavage/methylation domain-containing protein [Vibrio hippocampi]CAH0526867.1 hypothetical protein VHP8226_02243 [Vibrio hippocampi]
MKWGKGFTLIELTVAIVLLAIAMLTITTMLVPNIRNSAEPQYQVRAAALADSIFNQILTRSFDENSDHNGGYYRCGENGADGTLTSCTTLSQFGPDNNEAITGYNDVDDFGAANGMSAVYVIEPSVNSSERDLDELISDNGSYRNFTVNITVDYFVDNDQGIDQTNIIKRIQLEISASRYGPYLFTAYKGNY